MTRTQMIEKLEQYKKQDGTYHVSRLIADENPDTDSLDLTFAAFFGGDEEYNEAGESELVELARELNEEHGEQRQAEINERGKAILARLRNYGGPLTNEELDFLVKHGNADNVYDDPGSNRPTGIVIRQADDGKSHQETEEKLACLGL